MPSEELTTTSHFNIKPREVWCPKCKKYSITDLHLPVCEDWFGQPLITVVYSLIDGRRLTGADELGPTSS